MNAPTRTSTIIRNCFALPALASEFQDEVRLAMLAGIGKSDSWRPPLPKNQEKPPCTSTPQVKVLAQISRGRRTTKRIRECLGWTTEKAQLLLDQLERDGFVRQSQHILGTYTITIRGDQVLQRAA